MTSEEVFGVQVWKVRSNLCLPYVGRLRWRQDQGRFALTCPKSATNVVGLFDLAIKALCFDIDALVDRTTIKKY